MIPTPEQQAQMQAQQQQQPAPVVPGIPPEWQKALGEGLAELGKNWQTAPPPQQAQAPQLGQNRNQAMQMLIQDRNR